MGECIHRYMCRIEDLDKRLDASLTRELQQMFYDFQGDSRERKDSAWRMFWNENTPEGFLMDGFGIDLEHPTVRDAVAFDLVKLDDASVSNIQEYHFSENGLLSMDEIERMLLHRNFRMHLCQIEPEFTEVKNPINGYEQTVRTVDRVYQGLRLTPTVLGYFKDVFNKVFNEGSDDIDFENDLYLPFTNGRDLTTEIALIPNTHYNFPAIVGRGYYDRKWKEYKNALSEFGISAISSFALVDGGIGKNHTGEYLVKVQTRLNDGGYGYIVSRMNQDGQFCRKDGVLDISTFWSDRNLILGVCSQDFLNSGERVFGSDDIWSPVEVDEIPMARYGTSSRWSVFDQPIPDKEIDSVRNYVQFQTRLKGMEFCLKQLERDVDRKEIQCSQCFIEQTFSIQRMMNAFRENAGLFKLIQELYGLLDDRDALSTRRVQLRLTIGDRRDALERLLLEYNSLSGRELNIKIDLGQKIKTLKLEIERNLVSELGVIDGKIADIDGMIQGKKDEIQSYATSLDQIDFTSPKWDEFRNEFIQSANERKDQEITRIQGIYDSTQSSLDVLSSSLEDSLSQHVDGWGDVDSMGFSSGSSLLQRSSMDNIPMNSSRDASAEDRIDINLEHIENLEKDTRLWQAYMMNMGYELHMMKQMYTVCYDNTVKIRRLVRNFKDRIERAERDAFDEKTHWLRPDFSFTNVQTSTIRDIILLLDWWAQNPDGKTPLELGFDSVDDYISFRAMCSRKSLSLRKNECLASISKRKRTIENRINKISDILNGRNVLQYHDEYDVPPDKGDRKWTLGDALKASGRRLSSNNAVHKELTRRTVSYLKRIGLIQNEEDLEGLVIRNKVAQNGGQRCADMMGQIENIKFRLDSEMQKMKSHRDAIQKIIDRTIDAERKIDELTQQNSKIVKDCAQFKDSSRDMMKSLLIAKIENERKIAELRGLVKKARTEHLQDFSTLEELRGRVDALQKEYDDAVSSFKAEIGVDQNAIDNLVVQIYNQNMDEILKRG